MATMGNDICLGRVREECNPSIDTHELFKDAPCYKRKPIYHKRPKRKRRNRSAIAQIYKNNLDI